MPGDETVPALMHKIVATVTGKASAAFRVHGLNVQAARVMIVLLHHPGIRPGQLCDRAAIDNSTLSHMLRRLQAEALIVREKTEGDERSFSLHLTRKGRAVAQDCHRLSLDHEADLLGALDAAEAAQLRSFLLRVRQRLSEATQPAVSRRAQPGLQVHRPAAAKQHRT